MSPEVMLSLLRAGNDAPRSDATTVATMDRAIGSLTGAADDDRDPFALPSCF